MSNEEQKITPTNVKVKLDQFTAARDAIRALPKMFTPDECPLNISQIGHYEDARSIWGGGWGWTCGLCGAQFEE